MVKVIVTSYAVLKLVGIFTVVVFSELVRRIFKRTAAILEFYFRFRFWCMCSHRHLITALRGMQTRSSNENSVCPSVGPSVRQTRELWQNRRKICQDFYTIRKITEKKNGWWGWPLLPEILGKPASRWSEIADFEPYFPQIWLPIVLTPKRIIVAGKHVVWAIKR